jgi:pimeloyl-ACP methyl ester carboxylesterase
MVSTLQLVPQHPEPAPPPPAFPGVEPLDESAGFLGIGRSLTFPYPQWRDSDEYRTVFFDEGHGHPVVLVHGLGANATHFEHVATGLVSRYRVVGLDLVGCGWSRKPDVRYTVELLRDHLLAFLERRGIRRATLVGHSMGGTVVLATALARPRLVDSLVLMCGAGVAPLPRYLRKAAPLALRHALLYSFLRYGASFILDNVFVDTPEQNPYVRWFRESAMRDAPGYPNLDDFARVCTTLCVDIAAHDFSADLPALRMPVLGLWGDHDKLTALTPVLRQLGRIPRVRTVVLPRCGHMPMVERPADTLFHLERFLKNPP